MKYVLLGTLSSEWTTRQRERVDSAKAKLAELGITMESYYYTQGPYDFVDVVDAPDSESILAFSVWYASKGYGRVSTMPAFDDSVMESVVQRSG